MSRVTLIYFSPTGTTRKILHAIAKGYTSEKFDEIDLTKGDVAQIVRGVVIVGLPVYAGRVPEVFLKRLQSIKFQNTKSILTVVYGNRAYEDALLEIQEFLEEKGSKTLAGSAFIAEHSLSTKNHPIAQNRPDKQDLKTAYNFGKQVCSNQEKKSIKLPGDKPYKKRAPKVEVIMKTDNKKCTSCKKCLSVCPVGAIDSDNPLRTDGMVCLRCCACIRICHNEARELQDTLSTTITQRLFETCQERKEPELFM